jgi:hypothetical protein
MTRFAGHFFGTFALAVFENADGPDALTARTR